MITNKHGQPGIGVTGLAGLKGKNGNSIYFGDIDSFFIYIGADYLHNSSIDYDDIDYDITYADNDYRLNPIYHTGDILYILKKDENNNDVSIINYMVEITDDLTTCTKDYFINHIKYVEPFTVKTTLDNNTLIYPLNIINTNHNNSTQLYNINDLYYDSLLSIINYDTSEYTTVDVSVLQDLIDVSTILDTCTYYSIPYTYNPDLRKRQVLNNGENIQTYNYKVQNYADVSTQLLTLYADRYTGPTENIDNSLYIKAYTDSIQISVSTNKLYIDNLYVRKTNLGNINARETIYDSDIALDYYGHCYTLTETDYDVSTQSFNVNVQKYLNNKDILNDINYGYIHNYWNYNDSSLLQITPYKSNYIRGRFTTDTEVSVYKINIDEYGQYVRNWNDKRFKDVHNETIKELLINTLSVFSLNDVSNLLPSTISSSIISGYADVSGIINTDRTEEYVQYDMIKDIDSSITYIKYDNINMYVYNPDNNNIIYDKLIFPNKDIYNPSAYTLNRYIDTSYYSGIDNIDNTEFVSTIKLNELDDNGYPYRHHTITQWVQTPNGFKYYSKPTRATYNYETNTYDINANWSPVNQNWYNNLTYDLYDNNDIFNITFDTVSNMVIVDTSNNGTQQYINNVQLYENNILLIEDSSNAGIYRYLSKINISQYNDIKSTIGDPSILDKLYSGTLSDNSNGFVTYDINYKVDNTSYINTQKIEINGFKEYRTLPEITLTAYNDIESLEKLNNKNNGILCNEFAYAVDIDIDKFDYENWGQYSEYIRNPKLCFELRIPIEMGSYNDTSLNKIIKNIYVGVVNSDIDIFNSDKKTIEENMFIELQDLTEISLIKRLLQSSRITCINKQACEFSLDDVYKGNYKLYILITTINPEPIYINIMTDINEMYIEYNYMGNEDDVRTYKLTANNKSVISQSDKFKSLVMPMSMVAAYNQNLNKVNVIDNILYGSEDNINIALYPYMLDEISTEYASHNYKIPDTESNWYAYKFKRRYLQDNIQSLFVQPININDLINIIPDSDNIYSYYLAKDIDDIYDTYLQVVYNADLYNSKLYDDEDQFIYNSWYYLKSQYDQINNNTAVFIRQDYELPLRSPNIVNALKTWNKEYINYRYDSDNPFPGHNELYGNGYQYLPRTADNGQYIKDGILSLEDLKTVNNEYIYDNDSKLYYQKDVNKPEKTNDIYTPSKLFRTLLYNMKWCYPYYDSSYGMNIIKQYDISTTPGIVKNEITNESVPTTMPYNLCYSLYPRVIFNDEEQVNIILMLRQPSVVKEGQYEMTVDDLLIDVTDYQTQIEDPLNVLN